MIPILIRFLISGAVVSGFAIIGDVLKPSNQELRWIVRRGAFGGAGHVGPDCRDGGAFVRCHGGAFHDGSAVAFFFYASLLSWIMMRYKMKALGSNKMA